MGGWAEKSRGEHGVGSATSEKQRGEARAWRGREGSGREEGSSGAGRRSSFLVVGGSFVRKEIQMRKGKTDASLFTALAPQTQPATGPAQRPRR
jgi:hypothetical protein